MFEFRSNTLQSERLMYLPMGLKWISSNEKLVPFTLTTSPFSCPMIDAWSALIFFPALCLSYEPDLALDCPSCVQANWWGAATRLDCLEQRMETRKTTCTLGLAQFCQCIRHWNACTTISASVGMSPNERVCLSTLAIKITRTTTLKPSIFDHFFILTQIRRQKVLDICATMIGFACTTSQQPMATSRSQIKRYNFTRFTYIIRLSAVIHSFRLFIDCSLIFVYWEVGLRKTGFRLQKIVFFGRKKTD